MSLLQLALLAPALAAEPELHVIGRFVDGEIHADGTATGWVDRGWRDEVLPHAVGLRVFRAEVPDAVYVGTASVLEVKRNKTLVRVQPYDGIEVMLGDSVRLQADFRGDAPLAWNLARERVTLLDAKGRELNPWPKMRAEPYRLPDEALCASGAEIVRAHDPVDWGDAVDVAYTEGRFAGRTKREVGAAATPEQVCAALHFLYSASEAGAGEWTLPAAFSSWLNGGAELSFAELRAGSALDDAEFAALVTAYASRDDWSRQLYDALFVALESGKPDEARELDALLDRWRTVDTGTAAAFYAAMAKGELKYAAGDGAGAEADWARVLDMELTSDHRAWVWGKIARARRLAGDTDGGILAFEAGIAIEDFGVRNWEEYGDAMSERRRWPEAKEAYQRCVDGWAGVTLPEQPTRVAWCSMGLGEALENLGERDAAWEAWKVGLEIAEARNWNVWMGKGYEGLGSLAYGMREFEQAGNLYDLAVQARRQGTDGQKIGHALIQAGGAYWDGGDLAKGFSRVSDAIEVLSEAGADEELGDALVMLAAFERELGDPAAALGFFREAIAVYPESAAWSRARAHQYMGQILYAERQDEAAHAAIEEAIRISREAGLPGREASAWLTRAQATRSVADADAAVEAALRFDDLALTVSTMVARVQLEMFFVPVDVAEAHIAEALAVAARSEDRTLTARVQLASALYHHKLGDVERAHADALPAVAVMEGSIAMHQLELANVVGAIDIDRGRPDVALTRAVATHEAILASEATAGLAGHSWILQGDALLVLGRLDEAEVAGVQALRLLQDQGDPIDELYAHRLVAAAQAWQGQRGSAARTMERMAGLVANTPTPQDAELIRSGMWPMLGEPEKAIAAADVSLAVYSDADGGTRSDAMQNRARGRYLLGDTEGSLADLEAAQAMAQRRPRQLDDLASQLAEVHLAMGQPELALAALERVGPYEADAQMWLQATALRARALAALGRGEEAVPLAASVIARAQKRGALELTALGRVALGDAHLSRGNAGAAVTALTAAAADWDRIHASVPGAAGVLRLRAGPEGEVFERLALAHEAAGRPEEAARARARRLELPPPVETKRAANFSEYSEQLAAAHPDLYERMAVLPHAFAGLQADLTAEEALVVPAVLPDRVVVFVVRATGEPTWAEVPIPEGEVAGLVADMRDALQSPLVAWAGPTRGVRVTTSSRSQDPTEASRRLHALVMAPIHDALGGATTLVVAPGGRLRYVPFAALTDGERYLVEDYRLALLTASGTATKHRPVDGKRGVLALSNPDGTLPGASAEVRAIRRTWGRRAVVHDGEGATEAALRGSVGGAGILHLATHGVLDDDNPRQSYLLMAGEEARLTLPEIALLPLENVDLVVLSACETAVGERGEGREIAGLAYQFEVRGASSVVASLWPVDDRSTSRMMVDLYGGLRKRDARAEALRAAQLALLADPDTAHPYYWAPFILIGDWR